MGARVRTILWFVKGIAHDRPFVILFLSRSTKSVPFPFPFSFLICFLPFFLFFFFLPSFRLISFFFFERSIPTKKFTPGIRSRKAGTPTEPPARFRRSRWFNKLHATSLRFTISINYQIIKSIIRITLEYWYTSRHPSASRFFHPSLAPVLSPVVISYSFSLVFVYTFSFCSLFFSFFFLKRTSPSRSHSFAFLVRPDIYAILHTLASHTRTSRSLYVEKNFNGTARESISLLWSSCLYRFVVSFTLFCILSLLFPRRLDSFAVLVARL